jgi:hypothetical protein
MSASPRDGAAPGGALPAPLRLARAWLAQARAGEPVLAAFGLAMWLAMIPAAIALGLDERSLRGVSVWVKPLKFMASLGLFALTTAWFVGLLPAARRRAAPVRAVVGTILVAGSLEIGYIALQAALGRASHYNFDSPLSAALYSAMGLGALALTFTQAVLAREVVRHGGPLRGDPVRVAIVAGLVLTFLLGAGAGGLLGSMQPPAGTGLPIVGWHPRGDLRPAHFVGLHAQQLLPLAGLALARLAPGRAMPALWAFTLGYVALWAALVAMGLNGATVVAPGRVG